MKKGETKRRARQVPAMRRRAKVVTRTGLTVGELISAAYDVLGDTRQVLRVLGSGPLSRRMGRKLVFI